MIPAITPLLNSELKVTEQPSLTWGLNLQEGDDRVRGQRDGLAAMEQAVYKIINTERYNYLIYSYNYGIELADLFGQPASLVCPEIERRITEALLADSRITGVGGFEFDMPHRTTNGSPATHAVGSRSVVHVKFEVQTIFGNLTAERVVSY